MNCRVLGTGAYLPEDRVSNQQLVDRGLDTSDEWIVSHTGIRTRHIASSTETSSVLGVRAARRALEASQLTAEDLSMIVCATSTPDHPLPATANLVQAQLGARCGAMDLNAGCSGFAQALVVGYALCAQNGGKPVLVVGTDTYSRILDWTDRTTAFFFGDGAGAVVLGGTDSDSGLLSVVSGSDGDGARHITVEAGGSRLPITHSVLDEGKQWLQMYGRPVWKFAVARVPQTVRQVVAEAGLKMEDVDLLIPHQSNAKMLAAFASELEMDPSKLHCTVQKHANTAAASVALALDDAQRAGRLKPGQIVVVIGFGAGLSWCAACLRW